MKKVNKAVTLVEISIGVIISALLLVAIMNLFSVGIRGSTKGLSHQANMESASILMSQIEYDLMRGTEISDPADGVSDGDARWKLYYAGSEKQPATVFYSSKGADGVIRVVELSEGKMERGVFAQGHKVDLKFTHLTVDTGFEKFGSVRHGMIVELTLSSKDVKTAKAESFSMKRLIFIRSQ